YAAGAADDRSGDDVWTAAELEVDPGNAGREDGHARARPYTGTQTVTHSLLASLARLVTEASALDVTLSRVAVLLHEAIPFERLRVLRLDRADAITLYGIRAAGEIDITGHLIGDEPSAADDTADGVERSRLICTIRQGARVKGAVWLTSSVPDAFTDEHQELLETVGDLITLALYHDTVHTTEH